MKSLLCIYVTILSKTFSTQPYQTTDGRDYASNRSHASIRESPVPQSSLRSRYSLPERLPQVHGNGDPSSTPSSRYERKPEREVPSYTRSDLPPRQDNPSRDVNPYDSSRSTYSIRDAVATRNLTSLRDILPPREDSPISRDTYPPRDVSSRDYLGKDLPARDASPRKLPSRDISPREMPRARDSFQTRDLSQRDLPQHDILPPRSMSSRDDMSARDSYVRQIEMSRERETAAYSDSPSRYQSTVSPRDSLDRARFERAIAGARSDYPRYARELPSRESAMGTIRGAPAHYPIEGPQSKRPRY